MNIEFSVFAQAESELEAQLDQIGYMMGFGVGGGGRCGHYGLNNAKGGGISLLNQRVLDAIYFKLTDGAYIQSGVGLGVWRISRVGEDIQEVGRCNSPPQLRNQLLPKLVQAFFGLVSMSEPMYIYG